MRCYYCRSRHFLISFNYFFSSWICNRVRTSRSNFEKSIEGVKTGLFIWTAIAFILSLLAAGFVAGMTSRQIGLVYGSLTWATSIFSAVGSTLGSVLSIAGKRVETGASEIGDLVSRGFDKIIGEVGSVDTNDLTDQTN